MPRHGSQVGTGVLMADPAILDGEADCALIEASSSRCKRVTRSSLATEVCGAALGNERGTFVRAASAEMLFPDFQLSRWEVHAARFKQVNVIDAKAAFDAIEYEHSPQDRRTQIDIAAIREDLEQDGNTNFKWVPGPQQFTDDLTKEYGNGVLSSVMQLGLYSLKETDAVRELRETTREKRKAGQKEKKSAEAQQKEEAGAAAQQPIQGAHFEDNLEVHCRQSGVGMKGDTLFAGRHGLQQQTFGSSWAHLEPLPENELLSQDNPDLPRLGLEHPDSPRTLTSCTEPGREQGHP